jgi:hypothetical protein
LRKLAAAIVLALLVVIGTGSAPVRAQEGVVTFRLTNNAAYTIYVKMFSQTRSWVWPSANTSYILDDRTERSARLSCRVGEKICFGGSYRADDTPIYWGVGFGGTKACADCCLRCGTLAADVWHAWDLVE